MIAKANQPDALTAPEKSRLAELEATVEKHIGGFREAGAALAEIRDKRLYRATHATFEDYCRGVWSISKSRANQLVQSAEVVANLATNGCQSPANERQVRELAKLPQEQQADAMNEAVATAPNGKPTAAHVAEVVKRRTNPDITFGTIPDTDEPTARDDSTGADDDADEEARDWSAPEGFRKAGPGEVDKPRTYAGRTIPPDAPPLDIEAAVANDPSLRWTRIITEIQGCIARLPEKATLAGLPADRRRYVTDRFKDFAKQMKEAV